MRILFLTILFVAGFYYFSPRDELVGTPKPEIDSIKIKMGAPDRKEDQARALTVEKISQSTKTQAPPSRSATSEVIKEEDQGEESFEDTEEISATPDEVQDTEHVQEVKWTELEDGWNDELKLMLSELEPREGEAMHVAYLAEQESYQAELEALLGQKQNVEIDQLMAQLDYKHQEKLKDIFGAHYETVREHYDTFMEAPAKEDSE